VFDAISGEKYEVTPTENEDFQVFTTYLVLSCGEILRVFWYFDFDGTEVAEWLLCESSCWISKGIASTSC
jgi:hypothetical protein